MTDLRKFNKGGKQIGKTKFNGKYMKNRRYAPTVREKAQLDRIKNSIGQN